MRSWKVLLPLGLLIAIVFFQLGDRLGAERAERRSRSSDDSFGIPGDEEVRLGVEGRLRKNVRSVGKTDSDIKRKSTKENPKNRVTGRTKSHLFESSNEHTRQLNPSVEVTVTEKSGSEAASKAPKDGVGSDLPLAALEATRSQGNMRKHDGTKSPLTVGKRPSPSWRGDLLRDLEPGGKLRFDDGRAFQVLEESYRRGDVRSVSFPEGKVVGDSEVGLGADGQFCRFHIRNYSDLVVVSPLQEFEIEKTETLLENGLSGVRVSFVEESDGKRANWIKSFECFGRESGRYRVGAKYFTLIHVRSATDMWVRYTGPNLATPRANKIAVRD